MHDGGRKKSRSERPWRAAADAPDPEKLRRDLAAHVETLAGLVAASGRSEAAVEDDLGWPRGHLGRLLREPAALTYRDLLAVLAAIGVEPREFFQLLASPETEH